jgi:acetate kinase
MKSKITATILVINCGSSSLKYRIIRMPGEEELASGEAVRVGTQTSEPSAINYRHGNAKRKVITPMPDHTAALRSVIALIEQDAKERPELRFDCFAHRFVHPGHYFSKTTRIDGRAIEKLNKTLSLAPIHNTVSTHLIEMCAKEFKDIPQYVVFDTAFHRSIPPALSSYALPTSLVEQFHLKKVGFHGISHQYVTEESCRFLGRDPATQKIISCHLGSGGSSICAIRNGKSINNSMGFTPLEGLMMNTRCGDLDIGILLQVMNHNGFSPTETERVLNYKSGVLGVYSGSSDIRDVAKHRPTDENARNAYDIYVRRVRKFIGHYSLLLQKADILVFTDTLGIEMPVLRKDICEGLDCFGIRLDTAKNGVSDYVASDLTGPGSEARILAIPTNEEIMIAREAYQEYTNDSRN